MPKDRFSEQAENYALYRPVYPEELFTYIISFVKVKEIAWDCATGNGQSAVSLSRHFKKVFFLSFLCLTIINLELTLPYSLQGGKREAGSILSEA